jgi:preprotein translocase subunit YajC
MSLLAALFAEGQPANPDQPAPGPFNNMFFMLTLMGLFLFTMFWMPQRKQKKEQEAMMAALKPGAKVVTVAGIVGTIVKLKDGEDEVVLRSEDTKIKVLKSTITKVIGMEEEAKS